MKTLMIILRDIWGNRRISWAGIVTAWKYARHHVKGR
jgi:hypothetical protein